MKFMHDLDEPVKIKRKKVKTKRQDKFKIKNRLFISDDIQKIPIDEDQFLDDSVISIGDGELQLNLKRNAKKSFGKIFNNIKAFKEDHAMYSPIRGGRGKEILETNEDIQKKLTF